MISPQTPLIVYHGTNLFSAKVIQQYGIGLSVQRPLTDYGRGFYVTLHRKQAKDWARVRALHPQGHPHMLKQLGITRREFLQHPDAYTPAYLMFYLDIHRLLTLRGKVFPLPGDPKWPMVHRHWASFVARCRVGIQHPYDFVYGPVAGWHPLIPGRIRWAFRKDQLSLNSPRALRCLSGGAVVAFSWSKRAAGWNPAASDLAPRSLIPADDPVGVDVVEEGMGFPYQGRVCEW